MKQQKTGYLFLIITKDMKKAVANNIDSKLRCKANVLLFVLTVLKKEKKALLNDTALATSIMLITGGTVLNLNAVSSEDLDLSGQASVGPTQ